MNTPELIEEGAQQFGVQCIVVAIDAKQRGENDWEVYLHGGRTPTGERRRRMGARSRSDAAPAKFCSLRWTATALRPATILELTRAVAEAVNIPVIASGGAGNVDHIYDALTEGKAEAALVASIVHYGIFTIGEIKRTALARRRCEAVNFAEKRRDLRRERESFLRFRSEVLALPFSFFSLRLRNLRVLRETQNYEKFFYWVRASWAKSSPLPRKRLGQPVIAVDRYDDAPAMQVADEREVFSRCSMAPPWMLWWKNTRRILSCRKSKRFAPQRFYDYEAQGIQVVPSARAANFTMNRRAIRDLAARELGMKTAPYEYANTLEEFRVAVTPSGMPCVVKPLMSSSGKGQSTIQERSRNRARVAGWHFQRTRR